MALPEKPITRVEHYLNRIAGQSGQIPDVPFTRVEHYLDYIAKNGGGGGGGGITVDPVPTEWSTNAVSSGGVYDSFNDLTASDVKVEASGDVTETGNPVEIETSFAQNASELSVALEPVQDLHGYDRPWSGGNGKNKLLNAYPAGYTTTVRGVTAIFQSDGSVILNGTAEASGVFAWNISSPDTPSSADQNDGKKHLPNGVYRFSEDTRPYGANIQVYVSNEATGGGTAYAYSNSGDTTFTIDDTYPYNWVRLAFSQNRTFDNFRFYPMICLATETDPTFEPYSNICSIEGSTDVEVERVGKNLWNCTLDSIKNASYNINAGSWSGNVFTHKNGIVFTLQTDSDGNVIGILANGTSTGESRLYFHGRVPLYFDKNVQYIMTGTPASVGASNIRLELALYIDATYSGVVIRQDYSSESKSFSITHEASNYCTSYILIGNNETVNNVTIKPMIRLASVEDSTFEPYNSSSLTLNLGRDVYGGTVDVVNGTLTVDRMRFDITPSSVNQNDTYSNLFYTALPQNMRIPNTLISNSMQGLPPMSAQDMHNYNGDSVFASYVSGNGINMKFTQFDTIEAFRTYITNNPIYVVGKLATPQTYTLTPQLLSLLKGYNRISGDGVITIGYQGKGESDVQTELDEHSEKLRSLDTLTSSIAPVETSTASANYAVGDYLMFNGSLCKVTSAIATGETITIGSNVTVTTVAAELLAIIAQM